MPERLKGEICPADLVGAAILLGRIATGGADDRLGKAPFFW
jgi:hypothetical protein